MKPVYDVLVCTHAVMYHTIPYHTIPYHTIPYHTIPYHTIPYHTIPYHTIPYHTIPYKYTMSASIILVVYRCHFMLYRILLYRFICLVPTYNSKCQHFNILVFPKAVILIQLERRQKKRDKVYLNHAKMSKI